MVTTREEFLKKVAERKAKQQASRDAARRETERKQAERFAKAKAAGETVSERIITKPSGETTKITTRGTSVTVEEHSPEGVVTSTEQKKAERPVGSAGQVSIPEKGIKSQEEQRIERAGQEAERRNIFKRRQQQQSRQDFVEVKDEEGNVIAVRDTEAKQTIAPGERSERTVQQIRARQKEDFEAREQGVERTALPAEIFPRALAKIEEVEKQIQAEKEKEQERLAKKKEDPNLFQADLITKAPGAFQKAKNVLTRSLDRINQNVSQVFKQLQTTDPTTGKKDVLIGGTKFIEGQVSQSLERQKNLEEKLKELKDKDDFKSKLTRAFIKFDIANEKFGRVTLQVEKGSRERIRDKPVSVAFDVALGNLLSRGVAIGKLGLAKAGAGQVAKKAPKIKKAAARALKLKLAREAGEEIIKKAKTVNVIKKTSDLFRKAATPLVLGLEATKIVLAEPERRAEIVGQDIIRFVAFGIGAKTAQGKVKDIEQRRFEAEIKKSLEKQTGKPFDNSKEVFIPKEKVKEFKVSAQKGGTIKERSVISTKPIKKGELVFTKEGQPSGTFKDFEFQAQQRQLKLKESADVSKDIIGKFKPAQISSERIDTSIQQTIKFEFKGKTFSVNVDAPKRGFIKVSRVKEPRANLKIGDKVIIEEGQVRLDAILEKFPEQAEVFVKKKQFRPGISTKRGETKSELVKRSFEVFDEFRSNLKTSFTEFKPTSSNFQPSGSRFFRGGLETAIVLTTRFDKAKDTIVSLDTKQKQRLEQEQRLRQKQDLRTVSVSKGDTIGLTESETALEVEQESETDLKIETRTGQEQRQRQAQKQKQKQKQELVVVSLLEETQVTERKEPPRKPPLPQEPQRPFIPQPPRRFVPDLPDLPKRQTKPELFSVQVKRAGVFGTVAQVGSVGIASQVATDIVRTTARASQRILDEEGRVIRQGRVPKGFRRSKKDKGVLIELEEFRIDTPGELREITFKGLDVLKGKKKKLNIIWGDRCGIKRKKIKLLWTSKEHKEKRKESQSQTRSAIIVGVIKTAAGIYKNLETELQGNKKERKTTQNNLIAFGKQLDRNVRRKNEISFTNTE